LEDLELNINYTHSAAFLTANAAFLARALRWFSLFEKSFQ
jgi:hypothetical protein